MSERNTSPAVRIIVKRILAANRSRNRYIIAAILLTTMLLSSVFSIGISYLKSSELQQIRLMGTTAHAAVTNPTDEQVLKLRTLPYVKAVGLQHNVALIKTTKEMGNMAISLHWYDRTEWETFRLPTVCGLVGSYPQKYNEILVPLWILQTIGIDKPELGMELTLDFYPGEDRISPQMETFVLSGYYTDFMYIRSGNVDSIQVSEEFAKKSGKTVSTDGAASVIYQDGRHPQEYSERLTKDLSLTEDQKVKAVPMYDKGAAAGASTVLAFSCVIFFLMLTGYLLIYNVFYLSVSKDIRFYGLLKTIGTTSHQLKRVVTGQTLRLAAIGIPLGLAVGAVLSFAAVPMALATTVLETGAAVSMNPLIFIGASFFALLTTLAGAFKSAKYAAKITPMEALRFTGVQSGGTRKRSAGGGKPSRMALRNLFRDRRRVFVVLLSLSLGLTTFLTVTTLISSMDTDNYVASYVKNNFILENNTLDTVGTGKTPKQKFDSAFLDKLKKTAGITDLRTTAMEKMSMAYNPGQFSQHMEWFCKSLNIEEELTDRQIQDNFWGYLIGIDSRYIEEFSKLNGTHIDLEAFRRGEIALIGTNEPGLYSDVGIMNVTALSSGKNAQFSLGGFLPFGLQYAGGGMAPNLYISQEVLKQLVADPKIYKVNIDAEGNWEEQALSELKALTEGDHEITLTSRLEQLAAMTETKLLLYILGGGIALVLALIGILNFINVMATGVMARRLELSMLESIGMTRRQIRRMLALEGMGYAVLTALLTGTLGSLLTYGIFTLFRRQADYAVFTYPFIPMLLAIAAVFLVCAAVPEAAYRTLCRASIVERFREAE